MTKESETTKEIYNNKMCINNVPRNEINENVDDSSNSLTKYKNKENQIKKNNDLVYNVNISLEDIYNEVPKELNVARIRVCHLCLGRGYLGFGLNMSLCHICNGLMRLIDKKKFNIDTRESKIIFKNEGNMIINENNENMKNNMNNEINDLVINIYSKDDSRFERNEYDLIMNYNVSLIELYTEINILFEHLDNKKYLITYKDSEDSLNKIIHKMKIKVPNMGLPRPDPNPDLGRGDLYIKLNVILPDLSKSEVNKLKNIIFEPKNDSNNYDDTSINKIIIFNT
jgi:DnaJ-class molecular chaperone